MRTTLDLDKTLMDELVKESGCLTKTAAIEKAAREYLRILRIQEMVSDFGNIDIAPVYKEMRKKSKDRAAQLNKRRGRA